MKLNKLLKTTFSILAIFCVGVMNFVPVYATEADDLAAIQKKLADIRNQKAAIQKEISNQSNQANSLLKEIVNLKNQIDLLETQIEEKQLTIDSLNLQIKIMTEEIGKKEADITHAQTEVDNLQLETDNRMIDIYISQKTNSNISYVFGKGNKDIVKMSVYQSSIQDETNTILYELNAKKIQLAEDQAMLEQNKQDIEQDKASIEEEELAIQKTKTELDQQKIVLTNKRNSSLASMGSQQSYLNTITLEEQKALAEQTRLEQAVFNKYNSIPNGQYVTAGTVIGFQGCTGLCTGPHLHFAVRVNGGYVNPCSVLSTGIISGCGTSSARLARWPMDGSIWLTSGYGPRWGSFHYGLDLASGVSQSQAIKATHNGYYVRGFEPCSSSNSLCKNGGANYVIICENKNNCRSGVETMYWHLR